MGYWASLDVRAKTEKLRITHTHTRDVSPRFPWNHARGYKSPAASPSSETHKSYRWVWVDPLRSFSYSELQQHFCFIVAVLCLSAVIKLARGSFWFLAERAREWKDLHVQWFSSPVGDAAEGEGVGAGPSVPLHKVTLGRGSSQSFRKYVFGTHILCVFLYKENPSVRPSICTRVSEKRILMKFGIGSYY